MPNPYFKFKQFTVWHDLCAMKVNTDGVLLGAWATARLFPPRRVLDVGTGSGLIALMLAQRFGTSMIHAIDMDQGAYDQALYNFAQSPWSDRLEAAFQSLQDYAQAPLSSAYDLIVSNPPYFANSLKNPHQQRTLARHTDSLSHDLLISISAALLAPEGSLCLVLPADVTDAVCALAEAHGLYLAHRTWVCPKLDAQPKRVMLRFDKSPVATPTLDSLTIETTQRHAYTEEYRALTEEFYL